MRQPDKQPVWTVYVCPECAAADAPGPHEERHLGICHHGANPWSGDYARMGPVEVVPLAALREAEAEIERLRESR